MLGLASHRLQSAPPPGLQHNQTFHKHAMTSWTVQRSSWKDMSMLRLSNSMSLIRNGEFTERQSAIGPICEPNFPAGRSCVTVDYVDSRSSIDRHRDSTPTREGTAVLSSDVLPFPASTHAFEASGLAIHEAAVVAFKHATQCSSRKACQRLAEEQLMKARKRYGVRKW